MKLLLITDNLGAGGSQRQLCSLAIQFKEQGQNVQILTYGHHTGADFFKPLIDSAGISHILLPYSGSYLQRTSLINKKIKRLNPDAILAFLNGPSLYVELSGLINRSFGIVVSERDLFKPSCQNNCRIWFHSVADYITANSHTTRLMIEHYAPWLKHRLITVYNALDLNTFCPIKGEYPFQILKLTVVASHQEKKNLKNVILGLSEVKKRYNNLPIEIDWYGAIAPDTAPYYRGISMIKSLGLEDCIKLHPPVSDIAKIYQKASALLLASFYEGLPNTVCEAMACGKPVLISNVCDAGNLVREGINGFLFDPASPVSIADALIRFAFLSPQEHQRMGKISRTIAESLFNPLTIADKYIEILKAASEKKYRAIPHFPLHVPETTYRSLR